jgi:DNA polymerase I
MNQRVPQRPSLSEYPWVVVDTESTGLQWWKDEAFGVAISLPDGNDYYYDLRDEENLRWARAELPKIKKPIGHHIKYDSHVLARIGVPLNLENVECTLVRAGLIDEHLDAYDLDSLGLIFTGQGKDTSVYGKLAEIFGGKPTKHAQIGNLHKAPPELAGHYAMQDSRTTANLWLRQQREIAEQGLERVYKLEMDLLPVLFDIEHRGVRVDLENTELAIKALTKQIDELDEKIQKLAGGIRFNINSSPQLIRYFAPVWNDDAQLWELPNGDAVTSTKSGRSPSFGAENLKGMLHPMARMILSYRKILKLRDTFLSSHILGHHENGFVHTTFNQTKNDTDQGTGTGRLSSTDPALQQISKRDADLSKIIRSLFLPDADQSWLSRDWAQFEFRMFTNYSQEPAIMTAYRDNPDTDFHQMVSDLTGLPRSSHSGKGMSAKSVNLGLVFGMGMGRLAKECGLPYEKGMWKGRQVLLPGAETKKIMTQYDQAVPGVRGFLKRAASVAEQRGYVRTLMGRHIRFPHGYASHKAGGLILQGSSADSMKVKLIELHHYLKGTGSRLLLSIHDEIAASVDPGDDKTIAGIQEIYECFDGESCPIKLDVPIRSSGGVGPNWYEAGK